MNKIAFFTLGCKVNTYESNALMNLFTAEGFEIVDETQIADVYIINTCSVTNSADSKSRKMINRAIKLNPEAVICVMGCYTQTNPESLKIEGIDLILGNGNKSRAVELVKEKLNNRDSKKVEILDILSTIDYEKLEATSFDHTRAFVKIEDGCDNFCSYCIIPFARGPVRSKQKDEVLAELSKIADMGYKEVVLAGIHTGRYTSGKNYKLSDLLKDIIMFIPKLERIRLSSIEINEIDDDILELMSKSKIIADHLHLPLQSGNDTILELMNRRYDTEFFLNKVNQIRNIRPNISITTDVIVGFPYETDELFNQTKEFIEKINFSELHVFPYSMRKNTLAANMPQVDGNVKKERVKILLELSDKLKNNYYNRFINEKMDIIIEAKYNEKCIVGHASNYMKIIVFGDSSLIGKLVNVEILTINGDIAVGKTI